MKSTALLRRSALHGVILLLLAVPSAAAGATIEVTTVDDDYGNGGTCSLREAVQAANDNSRFGGCRAGTGSHADLIELHGGAVYFVNRAPAGEELNAGGDLDIRDETTFKVRGTGGAVLTPGSAFDRVLDVYAPLGATSLEIRNGNVSGSGGGVQLTGPSASLELADSSIQGNRASGFGGGMTVTNGASATLTNVTVSTNMAFLGGGGIDVFNPGSNVVLNNVTVSANTADFDAAAGAGDGGGLNNAGGAVSVRNSIVAGNTDTSPTGTVAPDCAGTVTSLGYNVIGDTANCAYASGPGDQLNTSPLLEPLFPNGGPGETHAFPAGSVAENAANPLAPGSEPDACPLRDQRGVPRPQGGACDVGAYERVECAGSLVNRVGTDGTDRIVGTPNPDGFLLDGGADRAQGLSGADALCGGGANDTLRGGSENDRLRGDGGDDRLFGSAGDDVLKGGPGADSCRGGAGHDTLRSC